MKANDKIKVVQKLKGVSAGVYSVNAVLTNTVFIMRDGIVSAKKHGLTLGAMKRAMELGIIVVI